MLSQSVHSKLSRVRKPRVHITYDVEIEGAVIQQELPFVVGAIGDYSGQPKEPLPPLKDRKFVQIDRDSFDEVMCRMRPALSFKVENTLQGNGTEMPVELEFRKMEDFEPGAIAKQIPPIKALLEVRNRLRDLLTKADRSEVLEKLLEDILQEPNALKELAADLEQKNGDAPGGAAKADGASAAAETESKGGDSEKEPKA